MLPSDKTYEVILDHLCTSSHWPDLMQASTDIALQSHHHLLGLGAFDAPPFKYPLPRQETYDIMSTAVALNLHTDWLSKPSWQDKEIVDSSATESPGFTKVPSWRELRLVLGKRQGYGQCSIAEVDFGVVPWENLVRLCIRWNYDAPMTDFIHDICIKLTQVKVLQLQAEDHHAYHRDPHVDGPGQRFMVDFTEMSSLEELEIDGICNHIPIENLVGSNLRALRLHCEDPYFSVCSTESQFCPSDIIAAAKIAPDLERLELDTGYIETLWHSVAIPGVDVDVEQYAFLNAICRFQRLKFLRLFPPFVARDSPRQSRSLHHRMPLADDQAIRIFEHLRQQCPSLQILSIAAIPGFMNIDTMSWEVRRQGQETILVTGHRSRNYRHRQTWVGQRKIRSEIKRFAVPQPYLPSSPSWQLTRNDRVELFSGRGVPRVG
jgi:hypothetical protein